MPPTLSDQQTPPAETGQTPEPQTRPLWRIPGHAPPFHGRRRHPERRARPCYSRTNKTKAGQGDPISQGRKRKTHQGRSTSHQGQQTGITRTADTRNDYLRLKSQRSTERNNRLRTKPLHAGGKRQATHRTKLPTSVGHGHHRK